MAIRLGRARVEQKNRIPDSGPGLGKSRPEIGNIVSRIGSEFLDSVETRSGFG